MSTLRHLQQQQQPLHSRRRTPSLILPALLLLFFILVECFHAALPPSGTLHLRTQASQFPTSFKHISGSDGVLYAIVQPLLADCLTSGYQLYEVTNAAGSKSLYVSCYDATNHVPRWGINVLSYTELIKKNAERPDQEPWFTVDSSDSSTGKAYEVPYDRGHLIPNNDFRSEEEKKLTFIVINRAPQLAATNRGIWRHIEHSLRDAILEVGATVNAIKALVMTRLLFKTTTPKPFATIKGTSMTSEIPISYNKVAIVYDNSKIREVLTMKVDNTDVTSLDQLPNIVKSWSSLGSTDPLKTNIQVTNVGTETDVTTKVDTKVKNFKAYVDQCSAMKKTKTAYFLIERDTTQSKWKVQVKNFSPCNHLCSFTMNQYTFVQSYFERNAMTQYQIDLRLRSLFTDGVEEKTTKDFSFYLPADTGLSELSSMSTIEGIFTYTCEDKRKFTGAKHEFQNLGTRTTIKEQRLVSYGGVIAKKPRRNRDSATRRRKKSSISATDLKELLTKEYPPSTLSASTSAANVKFTYSTFNVDHLDQFTEPRGRRADRDRARSPSSSRSPSPPSSRSPSRSPSRSRSRSRDNKTKKHSKPRNRSLSPHRTTTTTSTRQRGRSKSPKPITASVKNSTTAKPSSSSVTTVVRNQSPSRSRSPLKSRTVSRSKSPPPRKQLVASSSPSSNASTTVRKDRSRSRDRRVNTKATPLPRTTTTTFGPSSSASSGPSQLSTGPLIVKVEEQAKKL
ncbi:hypothetical protein C9374_006568 [Naegleria lovaniensis]|uniref:DNA/RNA non-specific endonuclease domain-containing protein n=1 Tax=Naegleria lovaniensis TaxID=51637 RepID=A0AA88KIR4_NAELO|nr:uncharacterized protein C9374_006568 [Naegleria lovaniensis]KAG2379451.1 hypothetical protein C9374_006568 [Naegleria lovaniensis]